MRTFDKIIPYIRVSTKRQVTGLEVQEDIIERFRSQHGARILQSYPEVESGRNPARPELAKAIEHAKYSGATLVVAKMDRLARDVEFTSKLMNAKVDFVIVDMPQADENMMLQASILAQYEVNQIRSRTKAALGIKKRNGVLLGSSRLNHWDGTTATGELRHQRRLDGLSKGIQTARRNRISEANKFAAFMRTQIEALPSDLSLDQIAEKLTERGFVSPRGKTITKATGLQVTTEGSMKDSELIRRFKGKELVREIAERAGTTEGAIANRLFFLRQEKKIGERSRGTVSARSASVKRSKENRTKVKQMRKDGKQNHEIAKELDLSLPRVNQIVRDLVKRNEIKPRVNRHG